MKASKFLNIFIPAVAGASIVVAPVSTYIVNSGIFRFQVQVDSLQDCATLSNKNATVGHDYVTNVEISGDYELDKFDIKVGGVRIPKKGYAYSPARKQLVIYGNYITSQDLSIAVDVKAKQATADFETDS
ncbi:MAG: hypothetical protein MJ233_03445 [Mycoplasmoidaceae bacterium]|nr:hypothetical protein [Mycoplasmoidaceae bacterium]